MKKCVVCGKYYDDNQVRPLSRWAFHKKWMCLRCKEPLEASKSKKMEYELEKKVQNKLPASIASFVAGNAPQAYTKKQAKYIFGFQSAWKSNRNSYIIKLKPNFVACKERHKFLEHMFESGNVKCIECGSFLFQITFDEEDLSNDNDIKNVQANAYYERIHRLINVPQKPEPEPWWGGRALQPNECIPVYLGGLDFGKGDFMETVQKAPKWLCECLDVSMKIINSYHADCSDFFAKAKFELFIQTNVPNAYGFIHLTMHPIYPIGIHKSLEEDTPENRRMAVVVLVHELLHAIFPGWGHDKINPLEKLLANKAGYYDALQNMQILYLSGKMRFCA